MEMSGTPSNTGSSRNVIIAVAVAAGMLICGAVVCVGGGAGFSVLSGGGGFLGIDGSASYATTREDTISYGQSSSGTLSDDIEAHNIYFQGRQGDRVTIRATGDGVSDPRIRVLGPNGRVVGRDDDSGGGLNAYLELTLNDTGLYTVRVDLFTGGDYTVTVDSQ